MTQAWKTTPWRELEQQSMERRRLREQVTYTLSTMPPLGAIFGTDPATLLVGVEEDGVGSLKAYLGARWKGIFIRITDPEEQETVRRAWGSGGHVWWSPIPPAEVLEHDPLTEGDS